MSTCCPPVSLPIKTRPPLRRKLPGRPGPIDCLQWPNSAILEVRRLESLQLWDTRAQIRRERFSTTASPSAKPAAPLEFASMPAAPGPSPSALGPGPTAVPTAVVGQQHYDLDALARRLPAPTRCRPRSIRSPLRNCPGAVSIARVAPPTAAPTQAADPWRRPTPGGGRTNATGDGATRRRVGFTESRRHLFHPRLQRQLPPAGELPMET